MGDYCGGAAGPFDRLADAADGLLGRVWLNSTDLDVVSQGVPD